jgi:hypothetical protein
MARTINKKPSPKVEKQVDCQNCGATIAYVGNDIKEYHGTDMGGGPDGREWVVCPNCKKDITLRSW